MENTCSDVIYAVKCPKCQKKAEAVMRQPGVKSATYREVFYKPKARLIQCNNCGFFKELSDENWNNYELWYRTKLKGNVIWAKNERHLDFLIAWFSKKILKPYDEPDRYRLESYPRWMITNKDKVLEKLIKMKQDR